MEMIRNHQCIQELDTVGEEEILLKESTEL